jgi:hypothetical protein
MRVLRALPYCALNFKTCRCPRRPKTPKTLPTPLLNKCTMHAPSIEQGDVGNTICHNVSSPDLFSQRTSSKSSRNKRIFCSRSSLSSCMTHAVLDCVLTPILTTFSCSCSCSCLSAHVLAFSRHLPTCLRRDLRRRCPTRQDGRGMHIDMVDFSDTVLCHWSSPACFRSLKFDSQLL